MKLEDLKIKIFADAANIHVVRRLCTSSWIKGYTTNPSLMMDSGIKGYEEFASDALFCTKLPISFEVIADDDFNMERQARIISSWGPNVYVKIPVTNSKGDFTIDVIKKLAADKIKLNVTALMTLPDVWRVSQALRHGPSAIISVFCGRIADTGEDPVSFMQAAKWMTRLVPNVELLWASTREIYNVFQADSVECDIITVSPELIGKFHLIGKNLSEYSIETCKQFRDDAIKAGLTL